MTSVYHFHSRRDTSIVNFLSLTAEHLFVRGPIDDVTILGDFNLSKGHEAEQSFEINNLSQLTDLFARKLERSDNSLSNPHLLPFSFK